MVPNSDRPHPEPQEILGGAVLVIFIGLGLIDSRRDAAT